MQAKSFTKVLLRMKFKLMSAYASKHDINLIHMQRMQC